MLVKFLLMRIRQLLTLVLAVTLCCWRPCASKAEEVEYKVKAAFLLNFAKFVTWPATSKPADAFVLCIVGVDPFGTALSGIESKEIGGKKVQLRYPAANADDLGQCQMAFISQSEQKNVPRIVGLLNASPVVLVSDLEGFVESGGTVEFKDQGDPLFFLINNSKAKKQGLSVSSSLLNLAVEVL